MSSKLPFKKTPVSEEVEREVIGMATDPKYGRSIEITQDDIIKARRKDGTEEAYYPTATGGKLDRFYISFKGPNLRPQTGGQIGDLSDYVQQQVSFQQHQIQEMYDQKMYQARQMGLPDEEYYNAAQQIKTETQMAEFEMRQRADAVKMSLEQLDKLQEADMLTPEAVEKAKYELVGLPAPQHAMLDPQKEYQKLDAYRTDIESKLKGFYKENKTVRVPKGPPSTYERRTPYGAFKYWAGMDKKNVEAIFIEEYNASTGKTAPRPATKQEQAERVELLRELVRVRGLQIKLMEQSGHIQPITAQQLKTANRFQSAIAGQGPTVMQPKNNDPLGILQ